MSRDREKQAAYMREYEQRPERKRRKRQWEDAYDRHLCRECGGPRGIGAHRRSKEGLCRDCRQRQRRARVDARSIELQALWLAGRTYPEIMAHFGWTKNYLRAEMGRMRDEGWALPRRTPAGRSWADGTPIKRAV